MQLSVYLLLSASSEGSLYEIGENKSAFLSFIFLALAFGEVKLATEESTCK